MYGHTIRYSIGQVHRAKHLACAFHYPLPQISNIKFPLFTRDYFICWVHFWCSSCRFYTRNHF